MTQSLTRRGYLFLEDFQKEYPGEVDGAAFTREMMIPAPCKLLIRYFLHLLILLLTFRCQGAQDLRSTFRERL